MQYSPFISVIVPNYNHAQYLEQRLGSVFRQTYPDFEVIILDDCSTDKSLEVINRYKDNQHLSQIVINETNSGSVFKQWKKGFGLAKGEWIWIAESDDYCELNFLAELMEEIHRHENVVVAYSNYVKCDEDANILSRSKEQKNRCYDGGEFVRRRLARACVIGNASGAVFKKSVLERISEKFLSYKSTGDYQFWSEVAACGNVVKVGKNLSYWRQSAHSVTGNSLSRGITAKEDRRVYEDICRRFQLNAWERYMAYAQHLSFYRTAYYDSEEIRAKILEIWNDVFSHGKIDQRLLWFVGSVERHLGILI